jgi:hypothetical protein
LAWLRPRPTLGVGGLRALEFAPGGGHVVPPGVRNGQREHLLAEQLGMLDGALRPFVRSGVEVAVADGDHHRDHEQQQRR